MTSLNITDVTHTPATNDLIKAVRGNNHRQANESIKAGGNVNVLLNSGDHLLHICLDAQMGNVLLNGGAKINARNANGEAPIHTSMRRNINDLTMLFIQSNADVNVQDNTGAAPLHLAEADAINAALLAANADVNIQDNDGDTPLLLAIRIKGSPMVQALVDAGADEQIRNAAGHNAFDEYVLLVQRREDELAEVAKALFGDPLAIPVDIVTTTIEAVREAYKGTFHAFNLAKARARVVPDLVNDIPKLEAPKQRLIFS